MSKADAHAAAARLPDTWLIIGAIGLLVYVASYFLAPGQFDMASSGSATLDPASYQAAPATGLPLFSTDGRPALFNAVFEGLTSGSRTGGAVGIMAFVLLTGGAFGVVMATGAFTRALGGLVDRLDARGGVLLGVLFGVFSLAGAVFGMGEEVIPFVLLLMPVFQQLGYNSVSVLMVTYLATQIGFATSWMNPFSVAIAQGIAELAPLSGMPLRLAMWWTFTLIGMAMTLWYANRSRSSGNRTADTPAVSPVGGGDLLVLTCLALTIGWLIWGVISAGYYLPEIATQFVILGVAAGVIGTVFRLDGMTANSAVEAFRQGAMNLLPAALVVGLARGIVFLMGGDSATEPSLMNTLLYGAGQLLSDLPGWLAALAMFVSQSIFNIFVTSGSGQAALTMPLMAPLADLLGVTRQVAVLAFQLGDGLTNVVVPTSAALMGCLGAAGLDWLKWVRAVAPMLTLLMALAAVFVIGAALLGYR